MTRLHRSLPPGPRTPSIVNLGRWVARPFDFLEECEQRYGDYFTVNLPGMPPNVVFSDPEAVRDLFTAPVDDARVQPIAGVLEPVMGEHSVMLLDAEPHQRQRRRMLPPFRGSALQSYEPSIRANARARFERYRAGQYINVLEEMQRLTLDVILDITLAPRGESEREHMRRVVERFLAAGTSPLATSMLWLMPKPLVRPLVYQAARHFKALPWAEVVATQDELDNLLYRAIASRRRGNTGNDLLSLLLEARDDAGEGMTDREVRDQLVTLLLAGHETTATTLTWAIAHLLAAGEWQALRSRMDDVELEAVLNESMRLSPVSVTVGRHLTAPMKMGRIELPAYVNAIACVYLTQRRADIYRDPGSFLPARWIGQRKNAYAFFPFGGGARRCLGMSLAYLEMKVILGELLLHADLKSATSNPLHPVRKGVTFAPDAGLPAFVECVKTPPRDFPFKKGNHHELVGCPHASKAL